MRDKRVVASLLLIGVIFLLTHLPDEVVEGIIPILGLGDFVDNILHAIAYGALAVLLVPRIFSHWRRWAPLVVLTILMLVGGFDELTQPLFGRSCRLADWASNMGGAGIGLLGWHGIRRSRLSVRRAPAATAATMAMTRGRTQPGGTVRVLIAGSIPFALAALAVAMGAFDRLAPDRTVSTVTALASILCYWLLSIAVIVTVLVWRYDRSRLLGLCFGIVIGAAGLEAGLRVAAPHLAMLRLTGVSSTRFHHLYPPNRQMFAGTYDGNRVFVRTNEDGLRTRHSRREFLGHRHRIIMMGDSFTFGVGVRQERTFPEVTETLLNQAAGGADFAVLNAGVVSYSPFLHHLLFDEVLIGYQPQQVFLVLDATDIGDDYRYKQEAVLTAGAVRFPYGDGSVRYYGALVEVGRVFTPHLLYPWRAVPALHGRVRSGYQYDCFAVELPGAVERNRFFIYRHPLDVTAPFFRATLAEIEAIASSARAAGAAFTLVLLPRFQHWNPADCPRNWESACYRVDEPYQFAVFQFFESVAADVDFEILNLLPAFQASHEPDLVFDEDPHLNERGHAFVAARMANYITGRARERRAESSVSSPEGCR